VQGEKLPPHDIEAEEAVIGSLLIDGDAIFTVASLLQPEDFFRERSRWIYEACLSLYQRDEEINQITVAQELSRQDKLEAVEGTAYLIHLVAIVPTSVHIESYAQIVQRLGVMRRLIAAAGQIAAIGYQAEPEIDDALNKAEDILFRLRHGQSPRDFVHIRQLLDQYFEENSLGPRPAEAGLTQVPTGFIALDELLGGLQRSDMVILAARPSLGKTSLALSIAGNAATRGAHVAIFSLEMARDSLVLRLVSAESGVDIRRLRLGLHAEEEERRVIEATGILSEAPIWVDDSPQLRVVEMRSKARRLHHERGIDLVIVDYLQLMQGDGRVENRVQEISAISRSLKALARELDVPVLAVSQLSRAPELRPSHKPMLSDLRESGSIEQDADVVVFIYREEMYATEEDWNKAHFDLETDPYPRGIADIMIAKNRNGPTDTVKLRFLAKMAKFDNLELEQGLL
jgi:replicative DNA helicase